MTDQMCVSRVQEVSPDREDYQVYLEIQEFQVPKVPWATRVTKVQWVLPELRDKQVHSDPLVSQDLKDN